MLACPWLRKTSDVVHEVDEIKKVVFRCMSHQIPIVADALPANMVRRWCTRIQQ